MMELNNVSFELLADTYSLPQAERLAYIDLCMRYLGSISRAEIMNEFKVAQAAASKDLALYRELKPSNSYIDTSTKKTILTPESYTPLVSFNVHTALNLIQFGFSRSELMRKSPMLPVEEVDPLYQPERLKEEQVSTVTRAIKNKCAVLCTYGSKSGDHRFRTLFPHALFMDRKNWYFRAYDRNTEEPERSAFKNFKLSRIFNISQDLNVLPNLIEQTDREWDEKITFIITFKKHITPDVIDEISREFSINGHVHSITCRAALACFVKTNWKIDLLNDDNNHWLYFDVLNGDTLQEIKCLAPLFNQKLK
ncbi:WYL domain-containing protein [Salmonella enterica]|nr:WYL domain-containing protein [Salmonella enterica]